MNKKFSLLIAAAALAFLGAGCMTLEPALAPVPNVVEPPPAVTPTQSATEPEAFRSGVLHVQWSTPENIAPVDVFTGVYKGEDQGPESYQAKNYADTNNYRKVGTVKDGPYAGAAIGVINVAPMAMGDESFYHFILPKVGKPILLAKYSPVADHAVDQENGLEALRFDPAKFGIDADAKIPELEFPKTFTRGTATFSLESYMRFQNEPEQNAPLFDPKDKTLAFTEPSVDKVYVDTKDANPRQNGFYAVAPDGTVRAYALVIQFYAKETNMPRVTWNDGTKNADEYWATDVGGCGAQNFASVVDGVTKADLAAVGKTEQGDPVYRFKNPNHVVLKDLYANSYSLGRSEEDKLSYDDFVKADPIFLWIDPLDRVIKFQKAVFLPAVECGKPVIYLYPPAPTDVSVKLAPQGGFTKSEPSYEGGWNVRATPSGELTNLKDGKNFPYLFWEGRGGMYETPKQGFAVAQKDVHSFLIEKLSKLGLNEKERADFMEFWEPRMTGSPYYFVTFLGNQAMDTLAPLTVTPKPDYVIRILMDFHPLAAPIAVQGYDIKTPKRDGFTVVEWGGVLR